MMDVFHLLVVSTNETAIKDSLFVVQAPSQDSSCFGSSLLDSSVFRLDPVASAVFFTFDFGLIKVER